MNAYVVGEGTRVSPWMLLPLAELQESKPTWLNMSHVARVEHRLLELSRGARPPRRSTWCGSLVVSSRVFRDFKPNARDEVHLGKAEIDVARPLLSRIFC